MTDVVADEPHKFCIASENPEKRRLMRPLLERHRDVPVLFIGIYGEQAGSFAREPGRPRLTGANRQRRRDEVYARFRPGDLRALVVSKIADVSADLPDAALNR